VIANSINIHGRRSNDTVTLTDTTVKGNLNANLGNSANNSLDLESTTVDGNLRDNVGSLTTDESTVTGTFHNVELGQDKTFTSTDTTFTGDASIRMGQDGVINLDSSISGQNLFQSSVSIVGAHNHDITVNQDPQSVYFTENPNSRNATFTTTSTTLGTPTVNSQTITTDTAPIITGTFDSTNTTVLTVVVNGTTYTLGTSSQLTSPSAGEWSLNLGGVALTSPVTTVTVNATDAEGNTQTGTGTITDATAIINEYVQANDLTATTTADGLVYAITTKGTGAIPTSGQTVSVDYSGFLLNTDGTLGTEFDSNTNSSFGHVTPFTFTLGAGQVIAGWDEAFALLPVGTSATLIIPPSLAYGSAGSGTSIPGNSILVFEVTVLSAS
jgi:FKBP-type peptidyl-prolyl cis-trans isomerase